MLNLTATELIFTRLLTWWCWLAKVRLPASLCSLCLFAHAASGRRTSQTRRSTNKQLSTSKRGSLTPHLCACIFAQLSHPFVLTCLCEFPDLSPVCRSGRQFVLGHSRELMIRRCCSLLWTQIRLWQCPIITPLSCGWFVPLLPDTLVCRPSGVFPQPYHAADQISAAGCEPAAFLLHHHRTQLLL